MKGTDMETFGLLVAVVALVCSGCAHVTSYERARDDADLVQAYEDCLNEVETRADFEACGELVRS